MPLFIAVLDANVLFPRALRDTCIRAHEQGIYQMRWTAEILEEMRRNLVKTRRATEDQARKLVAAMQFHLPEALMDADYQPLIATMTNHPKDRHVVAAAVACQATTIVTMNVRDFPRSALAPYFLVAQTPDAFLMRLWHQLPEVMLAILRKQSKDTYNPPHNIAEEVDEIARQAPQFATKVRARLEKENG